MCLHTTHRRRYSKQLIANSGNDLGNAIGEKMQRKWSNSSYKILEQQYKRENGNIELLSFNFVKCVPMLRGKCMSVHHARMNCGMFQMENIRSVFI